jgi:imidazoleglycerol-phosphate dehydratase / histidinol-phosphatase
MQKFLFIDRDGTLIVEPPTDFQVDSLEKLEYLPFVFSTLQKISKELPFKLVMVTNQDGLGTESFPEDSFWLAHHKMIKSFENEEVTFHEILIDKTFEYENAPTRKPRTGMLTHYLQNSQYDLANSYVIGDRITDAILAKNMGTKAILISIDPQKIQEWIQQNVQQQYPEIELITNSWKEINTFLAEQNSVSETASNRVSEIRRNTLETEIYIKLELEGKGIYKIDTGIGFFDHLLEQLTKHSGINLEISVVGDLHIDEHHTIEDTALALGEAFFKAIGGKRGMARYGHFLLPMDEALAQIALDFSGRPFFVWNVPFKREKIGNMPTEMFEHFFKSFSDNSKLTLNIKAEGKNEHHIIEGVFKAFAKALKMAIKVEGNELMTTKGIL